MRGEAREYKELQRRWDNTINIHTNAIEAALRSRGEEQAARIAAWQKRLLDTEERRELKEADARRLDRQEREKSEERIIGLWEGSYNMRAKMTKSDSAELDGKIAVVRKIAHKNSSAAEDQLGSIRELFKRLRKLKDMKEEEAVAEEIKIDDKRGISSKAPTPLLQPMTYPTARWQQPRGFFGEWTEEQRQEWIGRNNMTLKWTPTKGSPAEKQTSAVVPHMLESRELSPLPSRLSTVILSPPQPHRHQQQHQESTEWECGHRSPYPRICAQLDGQLQVQLQPNL